MKKECTAINLKVLCKSQVKTLGSPTLFSMDMWQCYEKVLLKERKVELNSDWC